MLIRYVLDPGESRFTVQAFAQGMLWALAHSPTLAIHDFTGDVRLSPDTGADAALQMVIRADSLELADDVKPADRQEIETRMRQEVLETATYPEIRFRSTAVSATRIAGSWYRLQFQGELSLHGVTSAHPVDAQLRVLEDGLRLSGEFLLRQSAHRIKRVSALGGMITVKDELKFSFDLFGRPEAG